MKIFKIKPLSSFSAEFFIVAESEDKSREIGLLKHEEFYLNEFKINGYVIEAYDEKTYKRGKSLEILGI